jgi:acetyltransferase
MHHYLRPLVCPQSVALVGASERPGSLGRIVYENLLAGEFKGELFVVNPHRKKVFAHRSYDTLAAIGRPIDLAIIATPPASVAHAIEHARGDLRAAVLMTAPAARNRAEAQAWNRRVLAAARGRKLRLVGPGALGVIRTDVGLNATFCAPAALPGRLALVAQSGAVSTAMLDFATPLGIGFSTVISLGGGIDVGFGELLDCLLLDPATDGILLYVEDPGDARAFLSALRAAARTKPVIVLKAGRSLDPRRVPSLDAVFDAALTRAGTVRVDTYTELFAAARILAMSRLPRGDRLGIVANGRGPGLLAADSAAECGVRLAKLGPATIAALDGLLPQSSARGNPVDVRGSASAERFAGAVATLLADPEVDTVLALHVARPAMGATDAARAVADVARGAGKPVLGAWLGTVARREVDGALEAAGIPNFYTPENAVDALSFLGTYRRNQAWLLEVPSPRPGPHAPDLAAAERIRVAAERDGIRRLAAGDAFALLDAFGVAVPSFAVVDTLSEAEAAASRLHFPLTLALDAAAVGPSERRTVRTRDALAKAWAALFLDRDGAARRGRGGRVLVRRATVPAGARAFSIGVTTDPVFGPVIAFGAGEAAMPRTDGRPLMLPPLNRRLASDLVEAAFASGRGRRVLADAAGRAALEDALTAVSALVCAAPWVRRLDVDPLVVVDGRAEVQSARVVVDPGRKPQPGYRHMAIHPYPVELEGAGTLRDGTAIMVRPIRPEDAELEREFVHGLSEQTRYYRFFYQLHELSPAMIARFTQVDYDRELALVAVTRARGRDVFIGVARYIINPDHESAEFAVVVTDQWQGHGVGWLLMQRLIAAARHRGLARLTGVVLRANQNMLRFSGALGFRTRDDPEDAEQAIVELPLRRSAPG